ncbi:MAG: oligosaccharide flippase family protein [Candidatus Parvarchaeota archaeon]|nr:oligosaccharide flippase family protein [Candidatus Parvarchaeota archaeon]MCW1301848.1 oligosaccharide flippase family protein [Candidatus Parvarchaeota archaeon]
MSDEFTGELNEERIKVASNSSYSFIGSIINYFTSFFIGLFLARFLGPVNFGVYSLAITLWALFLTISSIGINGSLQYAASRYKARDDRPALKWVFRHYLLLITITSISMSVAMLVLAGPIASFYHEPVLRGLLIILAVGLTFYSLVSSFYQSLFTGYQLQKYRFLVNATLDLMRVGQILVLYLGLSLLGVISVYDIAYFIAFIVAFFLARRILNDVKEAREPVKAETKELKSYSLFTYSGSLISIFYSSFIVLILGFIAPNLSFVGFYRIGLVLSGLVSAPGGAIAMSFFPSITKMFEKKNYDHLYRLMKDSIRFSSLITIPLVFGAAVAVNPLIRLFYHQEFLGSAGPFLILMIGVLLSSVLSPLTTVLSAAGKQKYYMYSTVSGAVIGIILSITLIPRFFSTGAALVSLGVTVVTILINLYFTRKFIEIRLPVGAIVKGVIAGLLMAGFILLLLINFTRLIYLPFILIAGLILYIFLLYIFRAINKADIMFVLMVTRLDRIFKSSKASKKI